MASAEILKTLNWLKDRIVERLPLSGGTMTGNLLLNADPTNALGAATKQYVDTSIKNGNSATATKLQTARTITFTGDATGSFTFDGSANRSTALTLAASGASAGSYGTATTGAVAFGGSFVVPYVTVDAKGRVTGIQNVTLTLPATPTSVTGNAGTASKLQTARTITINGNASGSTTFDGSANVSLALTVAQSEDAQGFIQAFTEFASDHGIA